MKSKKLVFGKGINDADYDTKVCPYYREWYKMIQICYSTKWQANNDDEDLDGRTVCKEWLLFSTFRRWMENQPWQGKQLDKDIIDIGNQVYCPEYCCFTTPQENSLLNDQRNARGQYPQGVCFNRFHGKFVASCNVNGKKKHLGYFKTAHSAEAHYINFKRDLIIKTAMASSDPRIKDGLLRHANNLVNNPV